MEFAAGASLPGLVWFRLPTPRHPNPLRPNRDPTPKTHPCLVQWFAALPRLSKCVRLNLGAPRSRYPHGRPCRFGAARVKDSKTARFSRGTKGSSNEESSYLDLHRFYACRNSICGLLQGRSPGPRRCRQGRPRALGGRQIRDACAQDIESRSSSLRWPGTMATGIG